MLETGVVGDIRVLSVHDEIEPIHFSIPSVVPSRYDIPGINAEKAIFEACKFSFPGEKPIRYALRRTKDNHPYVLITIVEPKTFIHGTEQQKVDEYGQRLQPDVMRVPVPIRQELIANEIERAHGKMGLMAVRGDITIEQVLAAEKINVEFLRQRVQQTNIWAAKNPMNVTPQSRRSAWTLHQKGLLTPLPTWAMIDPNAESIGGTMMNCVNSACGRLIPRSAVRCACGAVYNWKAAVDLGMVKPSDVPPSKRAAAGLLDDGEPSIPSAPIEVHSVEAPLPDSEESQELEISPEEIDLASLDGDAAVSEADLLARAREMSQE